jgi:hypothetical protein
MNGTQTPSALLLLEAVTITQSISVQTAVLNPFCTTLFKAQTHHSTDDSYGPDDMIPLIKVDFLGRGRPFHVAFAPGGMWFIRFKPIGSGAATTVWGPACAKAEPPVYPSSWVSLVDELRDAPNVPRDEHAIDFVTFGCHDLIIVRFENGNAQICPPSDPALRAKCSETVIKLVEEKIKEGWTVGNRTTLCQYDPEQYFIEWRKGTQANFAFNVGTQENVTRVKNVLDLVGNDAAARKSLDNPIGSCMKLKELPEQMANEARMVRFLDMSTRDEIFLTDPRSLPKTNSFNRRSWLPIHGGGEDRGGGYMTSISFDAY